MKKATALFVLLILASSVLHAQQNKHTGNTSKSKTDQSISYHSALPYMNESGISSKQISSSVPFDPLPSSITLPGTSDLGIVTKWHLASNGGPLHNIQVDPSNPLNVHACVMAAFNVAEGDTINSGSTPNFYPQRRVYYTFSSNGGQTWKTPVAISNLRTGYPNMILIKRGNDYVPVIVAHRNTDVGAPELFCGLFIEKGAPGAGQFTEVVTTRQTYANNPADIIWPSIALSKDGTKIFTLGSQSVTNLNNITYLQFGVFTLNGAKDNATFGGWIKGPVASDNISKAYAGIYAIHVAESGKIGVMWKNHQPDPDFGIYMSESTDEGKKWGDVISVYTPIELTSKGVDANGDVYKLFPEDGVDFFYAGENAQAIFTAYPVAIGSGNFSGTYFPNEASLLYWKTGMTSPRVLISKIIDGAVPASELDTTFISNFSNNQQVYLNEANLSNPVIARSDQAGKWSVLFSTWANNEVQDVAEFTPDATTYNKMTYRSIWRVTTQNNGAWFSTPEKVLGNDPNNTTEKKLDYRFPQISSFNPIVSGNIIEEVMFAVDTCGGLPVGGYVGFSDVQWKVKALSRSGVKTASSNGTALQPLFPNPAPSGSKITVPLRLVKNALVKITVTDILGREVSTVFSGVLEAGLHEIPLSTKGLTTSAYQILVRINGEVISRTFSVVR